MANSSSATRDLYNILGVPPNADPEDVKRAYRMAARRFHPDVNKHPGAQAQFRDIAGAYEVLGDSSLRQQFDQQRAGAGVDKGYLTLRIVPSRRVLTAITEPQMLYMLVEFSADRSMAAPANQKQTPLNLTLIIDRSLSMKGVRLDRTKAAAFQIIDQLSERDVISVVAFSDRAEVLIPAQKVSNRSDIKASIMPLQTSGATELFQGLAMGYQENMRNASLQYVNHIVLITDGHTYGDEQQSIDLVDKAMENGISLSALGIGTDWNDAFLDMLTTRTGGTTQYIMSPNQVVSFLNDHVRALSDALLDRVTLSLAPDPDIKIESIFRLSPSASPLPVEVDPIPIGQLQAHSFISVLLSLQLPALEAAELRSILRVDVTGDVVREQKRGYKTVTDSVLAVSSEPQLEDPPLAILDALSKLNLYRMQQRAEEALKRGNAIEATQRLEKLATAFLESGQEELAQVARAEAQRISASTANGTNMLSDEGHKKLKYGTRMLMLPPTKTTALE
ncbi:MAG: VWA domain-containing protein [Anaerolineae bacterium]|nr:VWA domain-containing protein [Anaerolineae bacterium]